MYDRFNTALLSFSTNSFYFIFQVILQKALVLLAKRHPNLSATISPHFMVSSALLFRYYQQEKAKIRFEKIIRTHADDWKQVVEEQANIVFPIGGPPQLLWKL